MAQNTIQKRGAVYAGNFIMQANAPLDDRTVVQSKANLLQFNDYVYAGMLVVVLDEHAVYELTDVSKKSLPDYSGWKKVGDDSGALDVLIERVITDEKVISQALNLLNALTQEHQSLLDEHTNLLDAHTSLIENLTNSELHKYETEIDSNSDERVIVTGEGKNAIYKIELPEEVHNCGLRPNATVYYGEELVLPTINLNSSGKVTISWTASTVPTNLEPIKILIIGR